MTVRLGGKTVRISGKGSGIKLGTAGGGETASRRKSRCAAEMLEEGGKGGDDEAEGLSAAVAVAAATTPCAPAVAAAMAALSNTPDELLVTEEVKLVEEKVVDDALLWFWEHGTGLLVGKARRSMRLPRLEVAKLLDWNSKKRCHQTVTRRYITRLRQVAEASWHIRFLDAPIRFSC